MSRVHRKPQAEPFKRRRFVAPRRRRRLLARLAKPFASAVALVVLPAATGWWIVVSPQFSVREVVVGSTDRVEPDWVAQRLEPLRGRHILTVRLKEIERRLDEHPWVDTVEMRKELPGRLSVELHERQPAALLLDEIESGAVLLDREGHAIAPAGDPSEEADLVVLERPPAAGDLEPGRARRAIELAAEWSRHRHETVSRVEILGARTFRLRVDTLPFAVLVGAEALEPALARLDSVAAMIAESYPGVDSVDLRFSQQIVFQTAALPPTREG